MRKKQMCSLGIMFVMLIGILTGCKGVENKNDTLVNINKGEESISYGYGNFYAKYTQAIYDGSYASYYGEGYWSQDMYGNGNTLEDDVKDGVMEQLKTQYLFEKHAKDYKVSLTEADNEKIKEVTKDFFKKNNKVALKNLGASKAYVEEMLKKQTFEAKMREAIGEEAKVDISEEDAKQRTFTYSLIGYDTTVDENGNEVEVTEDRKSSLKEKAQKIALAADFEQQAQEEGATVTTYSYGKDDTGMDQKVLAAADALKEGEVSDVIEVENVGLYVIKLEKEFDKEATKNKIQELEQQQKDAYIQEKIEEWSKDLTWDVNEKLWSKVKFDKIFTVTVSE